MLSSTMGGERTHTWPVIFPCKQDVNCLIRIIVTLACDKGLLLGNRGLPHRKTRERDVLQLACVCVDLLV